jgi:hypothetical protein
MVAVMTIAMNSSATIIGRRRFSDRWIPFKFFERLTAVISVEAAREISHRRIGDQDFEMSNTRQRKPRNRDMRFRNVITAVG